MFGINVDGTKERSRLARWLLGIGGTGVGLSGCFLLFTQGGMQVTDCGFDAHGAYAKVRVNHLLGWRHDQEVWIDFYLDGKQFAYAGRYDLVVPVFGDGSAVVQAGFPSPNHHVTGRRVYVDLTHRKQVTFVTKEFADAHPHNTDTEVVPDASHTLSCGMDYTDPD
jgi:hypothetical protein